MPIDPRDVLRRAQTVLQDDGTRWPVQELVDWLNDGLTELSTLRPSVYPVTTVLPLVEGARQRLPDGATAMVRPIRTVSGLVPPYEPGRVVTSVSGALIDAAHPGWQSSAFVTRTRDPAHVIPDPSDPLAYEVWPPNDGTGKLEAVIGQIPPAVAPASGQPASAVGSYTVPIQILATWRPALVDFVCFRAFSKDLAGAGMPDRAAAHLGAFNAAVGRA